MYCTIASHIQDLHLRFDMFSIVNQANYILWRALQDFVLYILITSGVFKKKNIRHHMY